MSITQTTCLALSCNGCSEPFELDDFGGYPHYTDETQARKDAAEHGWLWDGDSDWCPTCQEERAATTEGSTR